jgi:hypothetical protein
MFVHDLYCRLFMIHIAYGSWIYNYLLNQCLSPLMLWVRITIRVRCTTLGDKVCQWLGTGRWISPSPMVSSTYKTVPLFCACPKPGPGFPTSHVVVFFVICERWLFVLLILVELEFAWWCLTPFSTIFR